MMEVQRERSQQLIMFEGIYVIATVEEWQM